MADAELRKTFQTIPASEARSMNTGFSNFNADLLVASSLLSVILVYSSIVIRELVIKRPVLLKHPRERTILRILISAFQIGIYAVLFALIALAYLARQDVTSYVIATIVIALSDAQEEAFGPDAVSKFIFEPETYTRSAGTLWLVASLIKVFVIFKFLMVLLPMHQ